MKTIRHVLYNMWTVVMTLAIIPGVLAADRIAVKTIVDRPADYQAKVVTVEGTAKTITNIPVHRGAHRCGGGPVYDTQKFTLEDESGTIRLCRFQSCQPNAMEPVRENEHLRIRGVVVADEKDPKGIPVIYADAIDRITSSP